MTTIQKVKMYSKTCFFATAILAVIVLSIMFAGKNKKILELLKQLRMKDVDDKIKTCEEAVSKNEHKIEELKKDTTVSQDKIDAIEEENKILKEKINSHKSSMDDLINIYNTIGDQ